MANIVPPFTEETARKKVKAAQAAWNSREPARIVQSYTTDSIWRNRSLFVRGHPAILTFLQAKWQRELDYRLRKELFSFSDDKIAVQFWYEYREAPEQGAPHPTEIFAGGPSGTVGMEKEGRGDEGNGEVWWRVYGLEDWTFDKEGKMRKRMMSANEVRITERDRWFRGEIGEERECRSVDDLVDRAEIGEEHW